MKTLNITLLCAVLLLGNVFAQEGSETAGTTPVEDTTTLTEVDPINDDGTTITDDGHEGHDHDDNWDPDAWDDNMSWEAWEAEMLASFNGPVTMAAVTAQTIKDVWQCYDSLEANMEDTMGEGYVYCDYMFPDAEIMYFDEEDEADYAMWNDEMGGMDWQAAGMDLWELEMRFNCLLWNEDPTFDCFGEDAHFEDFDMEHEHYDQWGDYDEEFEKDETWNYLEVHYGPWTENDWKRFMAS